MVQCRRLSSVAASLLLAFVVSIGGMANVAQASVRVRNVPVCIDDLCFVVPVHSADYFVKVADFNSDGTLDLYVTGHRTRRFVGDFLLYQINPQSYSINESPTQAEVARVRSAPISPITVSRMELNADRFYDFYLRNVDEVIAGASDIIVTLARGVGGTPTHVVPVADQFATLVEGFTGILSAPEGYQERAARMVCPQSSVGIYVPGGWNSVLYPAGTHQGADLPSWLPYFSSLSVLGPTLSYSGSGYLVNFAQTGGSWGSCVPGIALFQPEYRKLVSVLNDSDRVSATDGDIWSQAWCDAVFNRYGKTCRNRYVVNNVGVGAGLVVTTAVIVAVLYYTGQLSSDELRDLVEAVESAGNDGWAGSLPTPQHATDSNRADVGPGTQNVPAAGVDNYAFQTNCDHGPNNVPPNRGKNAAGSSDTLGKGLDKLGCGCPAGSDAHHILPKSGGPTSIRECLDKADIDVDHPANGVCLPQKADPSSKAVVHGSANGKTYWASVAKLCDEAYENGGPGGVRQMLDQARENLINGNKWWKPGGGPFYPQP